MSDYLWKQRDPSWKGSGGRVLYYPRRPDRADGISSPWILIVFYSYLPVADLAQPLMANPNMLALISAVHACGFIGL